MTDRPFARETASTSATDVPHQRPQADPPQAIVVGAGLAGAAACVHLARQGWHLHLIDQHAGPAEGASALPVGMLSPHVTRSPTPLSRLTAIGVPLTRLELANRLQQGHGWQACEVDNLGADAGRWPAALVRPGALVAAWLEEARQMGALRCQWSTRITSLRRARGDHGAPSWQALDDRGQFVAQAPAVVIAGALGSLGLAADAMHADDDGMLPLRPVKGQMSLGGLSGRPLGARPQRNQGIFVPEYEDAGLPPRWPGRIWAMGSTYERGVDNREVTNDAHARNAQSLTQLNPDAASHLEASQAAGQLLGWAEVRCASLDRLPLVGQLPDLPAWREQGLPMRYGRRQSALPNVPRIPGLYTLCALGSRGLSLAALCGQLLAARMQGRDGELDPELTAALDPARFAWRRARRQMPEVT
ncbi:MAG: FAD-dependent oxidoreductase [Burkholderiaceae bacterium]